LSQQSAAWIRQAVTEWDVEFTGKTREIFSTQSMYQGYHAANAVRNTRHRTGIKQLST
jgi:hypothetical protein